MITIYHLSNSRSERIIWLCEELRLKYRLERFEREPSRRAPAALKAIHPLGRAPIIRDGAITLIESGAILEYLIERYGRGRLKPKTRSPDYPRYLQWLHFSEGTAAAQLLAEGFALRAMEGLGHDAGVAGDLHQRYEDLIRFIEAELGKSAFVAGPKFTAADIPVPYIFALAEGFLGRDLSPFRNIAAYRARLAARPSYQKAMKIAGAA